MQRYNSSTFLVPQASQAGERLAIETKKVELL